LRLLQVADFDLGKGTFIVHGKGGKVMVMPIAFDDLAEDLRLKFLTRQLLRHESVATTQTYLHPTRDDLEDALARLQVVRSRLNARTHDNGRYVKFARANPLVERNAPLRN